MITSTNDIIELQIDDPVNVIRSHAQQNTTTNQIYSEGIVAYLGPVKFGDRSNDWVGIQLTGDSFGLGKNDGSVEGERYFTCRPNSGIFVRNNQVVKRRLSNRLEHLRLRKELAIAKETEIRNIGKMITADWNNSIKRANMTTMATITTATQNQRRLQSSSSHRSSDPKGQQLTTTVISTAAATTPQKEPRTKTPTTGTPSTSESSSRSSSLLKEQSPVNNNNKRSKQEFFSSSSSSDSNHSLPVAVTREDDDRYKDESEVKGDRQQQEKKSRKKRRKNGNHRSSDGSIMNLKNEIDELQLKLEKEEVENSMVLSQVTGLQSEIQEKEEKQIQLQLQANDLQFQLTETDKERKQLQSKYTQLHFNLGDSEEEFIIELGLQMEQLQSKFNEKEMEVNKIQSQLIELKKEQIKEQQKISNNINSETNDTDTSTTITIATTNSNKNEERETTVQLRVEIIELKSKVQELSAGLKSKDIETMTLREALFGAVLDTKEHINKVENLEKEQSILEDKLLIINCTASQEYNHQQQDEKQNNSLTINGNDEEVPMAVEYCDTEDVTTITDEKQYDYQEESLESIKDQLASAQVALIVEREARTKEINEQIAMREKLMKLEDELRSYRIAGSVENIQLLKKIRELKIMNEKLSKEKNYLEQQKQQQQIDGGSSVKNSISTKKGRRSVSVGRLLKPWI